MKNPKGEVDANPNINPDGEEGDQYNMLKDVNTSPKKKKTRNLH